MDLFERASTVRLISYNDGFLVADGDCVGISHGSDRHANASVWAVELVEGKCSIRLRSCHGTYLTASAGKRVVQSWPSRPDPATEWEPSRDGMEVRLRSVHGHFLRPNGGLTPWRNAVTHAAPYRSKSREKMLWDVEVVEKCPSRGSHVRTRSSSSSSSSLSTDYKKDDGDEDDDEGFHNNVKSWWCAPTCLPF